MVMSSHKKTEQNELSNTFAADSERVVYVQSQGARIVNFILGVIAGIGLCMSLSGCYGPPVAPRESSCKDFRFVDTTARADSVALLGRVCVR